MSDFSYYGPNTGDPRDPRNESYDPDEEIMEPDIEAEEKEVTK